jgi:competence protein ComEC
MTAAEGSCVVWESYTGSMPPRKAHGPWRLILALLAVPVGAGLQLQQSAVAGPWVSAGVLSLAMVAGWVTLRSVLPSAWRALVTAVAVAAAVYAVTDMRAHVRLGEILSPTLEARDIELVGIVVGLPRLSSAGTHFELHVESATYAGMSVTVPQRIRLSWPVGWDGESLLASPPTAIVAGDRWRLTGRLRRPHGAFNPHGFDLELWMFEQGLGASGSVRPGAQWMGTTWRYPMDRWRQRARDAVLLQVPDARAAGVLAALAVGDQASIDRDDWDLFRITGVAHLMAISGLHITMFAWLTGLGLRSLWRRLPRAGHRIPAPDAARWGGLIMAAGYAVLSGWAVPAQRTIWMLAAVVVLRSLGRRWPWPLVWLSAGAIVTAVDPWALLQPGFWLSFVAVGVLMGSEPVAAGTVPGRRWTRVLRDATRTQVIASLALAPLSLFFFQQVSLVGLASNLLAVPWVTLLITPLALLGLIVPALWGIAAWCVDLQSQVLSVLAAAPLAQWTPPAAPVWAAILGVGGGLLLILPLPWRMRLLGLPLMLPLLAPAPVRPMPGEIQVIAVDVGQGTAVVVRTRRHLLLYDTGPRYTAHSDAGARHVLPLLRALGERKIDRLVLSHRDIDHVGGAEAVLANLDVAEVMSSLEPDHPLRGRSPDHQTCAAGQTWVWDAVRFEVIHPQADDFGRRIKPNGLSCVIRVTDRHGPRLLLTGDIEAQQEGELLAAQKRPGSAEALRAALLMLPHHGSRTSSTAEFLSAVSPRHVFVQAAYLSRFGHPAAEVQARVAATGAGLSRSDLCGAWIWPSDALMSRPRTADVVEQDSGMCERHRRQRYWHHSGVP